MRISYQQLLYWSTTGYDVLLGGFSRSYYVVGYAKSGTNWLCGMLSDYTSLPVYEPWKHWAPKLTPQIFHMMRLLPFGSARKRSAYIMRDCRDTMVSRYFHILHREPEHRRAAERFIGREMSAENIREDLPRFIEFMSTFQGGCADYKSHLTHWLDHDYGATVKYEDLLSDTVGQMDRVLRDLTGSEPDMIRLEQVVKRNAFESKAQRARGEENTGAFLRKGISGDWRNYFTPAAARAMDEYAGQLLIRLGYERDRDWVQQVRATT